MAIIVTACGSSGSSGKSTSSSTNGLSGATDTNAKPVEGGSITYALEADTTGGWCLPESQLAISGIQVARAIYDTLTEPDSQGNIKPFLAESVTPNADNTVFTIKLRPNIKFSDGTALDSQVVKDNIDAWRGALPQRNPVLFKIVFQDIASTAIVDPLTLTVTTKVAWPAFPWFLWSSGRLGIMGEAQVKSANCNTNMVGTGPFEKVSWTPNDKFVAKKNPNYWRKDKYGQQLPYLDQITFIPQEDGPQRVNGLEAGDYDVIHTSDPLNIVQIRKDIKDGKLSDIESDRYSEISYDLLQASTEPFNHLSARQAVAYAIDRDAYNKLRNDNILQEASGPFAPGNPGYLKDTGLPSYNPTKAKAAAAQYKQETGKDLTFTITHSADTDTTKDAQLIQQMLNDVGIKTSLNPVADQSTLINVALSRKFNMILWRNHPGADPDTQYVWWHCGNSPAAGSDLTNAPACDNLVNFGAFNDPTINQLLDQGRSEADPAKRLTDYENLNKQFAKELWNLWGYYVLWTIAFKPNVHGVLGTTLPDGSKPFPGLATGHDVAAMWVSK